jgi:hypothetical protein
MEKKKAKMLEFKSTYLKKSTLLAEIAAEKQKYLIRLFKKISIFKNVGSLRQPSVHKLLFKGILS